MASLAVGAIVLGVVLYAWNAFLGSLSTKQIAIVAAALNVYCWSVVPDYYFAFVLPAFALAFIVGAVAGLVAVLIKKGG